ncbi:FAD:protein FMN transferase [Actinomadura sp. WMMA1423]|uniref:FAD:protein FMN transferase n=1 Tax=Actinomadura sp. WMMA1423 TaxID=2591108 RepID=UPI0011473270|nr:FAD:protein FMN transferase [Actinomadura sp. WMMA1423]
MIHGTEDFPLWGGAATVMVDDPGRLGAARRAVDHVIDDIDAACGAFRDDSDLARVNAAAGRPVRIGSTFLAVLWTALHACDLTGGLVDPLVGAGSGAVLIDDPPGTVTIPAGTTLDLWNMAMAFAADRAAESAAGQAGCGVCVGFPGSVATAGPVPDPGWPVQVTGGRGLGHRGEPPPGQEIVLRAPGLATSSPPVPGRTAGHWAGRLQVVPRAADAPPVVREQRLWRTVSVIGLACVAAKTASIAALASGSAAAAWLGSRELRARMVDADGRVTTVGDWPAGPGHPPAAPARAPVLNR